MKYWLIAVLIFVGFGLMDRGFDLLDPCHENPHPNCIEAIDNTGDL